MLLGVAEGGTDGAELLFLLVGVAHQRSTRSTAGFPCCGQAGAAAVGMAFGGAPAWRGKGTGARKWPIVEGNVYLGGQGSALLAPARECVSLLRPETPTAWNDFQECGRC